MTATLLGVFVHKGKLVNETGPVPEVTTAADLGIIYLPITAGLAEYYGLEADSGALVTHVVPDSPADRAGVEAGDVILSFNGTRLNEEIPLLGMIMSCSEGENVTLEMWRTNRPITLEFFHQER